MSVNSHCPWIDKMEATGVLAFVMVACAKSAPPSTHKATTGELPSPLGLSSQKPSALTVTGLVTVNCQPTVASTELPAAQPGSPSLKGPLTSSARVAADAPTTEKTHSSVAYKYCFIVPPRTK